MPAGSMVVMPAGRVTLSTGNGLLKSTVVVPRKKPAVPSTLFEP